MKGGCVIILIRSVWQQTSHPLSLSCQSAALP